MPFAPIDRALPQGCASTIRLFARIKTPRDTIQERLT